MISFNKFYLTDNDENVILDKYPRIINNKVDGLEVIDGSVPNIDSIDSTLYDYEILDGLREIQMSEFDGPQSVFYDANDFNKSRKLAEEIKKSGKISPLIIVIDNEGPYILEGAHRYVALYYLGIKSFPALVVLDKDII